jgi:hypothetical protein
MELNMYFIQFQKMMISNIFLLFFSHPLDLLLLTYINGY